jgi:molecular chaperone GrpE
MMNDDREDTEDTEDLEGLAREAAEWAQASDESSTATAEELKKLQEALEQKTQEAAEAQDKYLRTYADFENYRKRMQRDQGEFRKYANEQLMRELLTVVDHLGLALKHAADAGETGQGLREGVELVYKQLRDVLEKFGVKPFKAEGEPFDPAEHDAVMQEVTDEVPENTVVQVFQEGYRYHDKVLRHAKVSVAKKPPAEEPVETSE